MLRRGKAAVGGYENMVAEGNFSSVGNNQIMIGVKEIPNGDVIAIIAPKRRHDYGFLPHRPQKARQHLPLRLPVVGMKLVIPIAYILASENFRFQIRVIARLKQTVDGNLWPGH